MGAPLPLCVEPGAHTPSLRPTHAACTGRQRSLGRTREAQDPIVRCGTLLCYAAAQRTVRAPHKNTSISSPARRAGARAGGAPAAEGRTRDLRGAAVVSSGYVNGAPRTQLELLHGLDRVALGGGAARASSAGGPATRPLL